MLASASLDSTHAVLIIGFNIRPEQRARELAERENIDIRLHSIIYKMEEEIRNAMIGMLDKTKHEVILGRAEIRNPIRVPKVGTIAGSMVMDGVIKRNADARLIRDNTVIQETKIAGLRRFKDDVSEVKSGFECGILLDRFQDVKVGDIIEAYTHEEVAPTTL
jgi:translation initiation factor IF-2